MREIQDIYLQAGEQAVLLLHSFTSNSKEMRHLASVLHKAGYTSYVPNLAGHGASPEQLFASSMDAVWQGAKEAFEELLEKGYNEIYVVGQSLGGVLGIRLANEYKACKALCIISSPVLERPIDGLEKRVEHFSKRYLHNSGKTDEELQKFLHQHFPRPPEKLIALQQFIVGSGNQLSTIKQPMFLAKGALDENVFQHSIDLIEQSVNSKNIVKKTYKKSGHLITLGKEREELAEDLVHFLSTI